MKTLEDIEPQALKAAANVLDKNGRFHHWWNGDLPSWEEFDSIGKSEYLDIVTEIILAYENAKTVP